MWCQSNLALNPTSDATLSLHNSHCCFTSDTIFFGRFIQFGFCDGLINPGNFFFEEVKMEFIKITTNPNQHKEC